MAGRGNGPHGGGKGGTPQSASPSVGVGSLSLSLVSSEDFAILLSHLDPGYAQRFGPTLQGVGIVNIDSVPDSPIELAQACQIPYGDAVRIVRSSASMRTGGSPVPSVMPVPIDV